MGLLCVLRLAKRGGRPRTARSKQLAQAARSLEAGELAERRKWTRANAGMPHADMLSQYQTAAMLHNLYRERGYGPGEPRSQHWYLRMLFELAENTGSLGLLHAATTMAITGGFEDAHRKPAEVRRPLTREARAVLEASTRLLEEDSADSDDCAYLVEVRAGERFATVGPNFSSIFWDQREIQDMLERMSGHYKIWKELIADKDACARVTGTALRTCTENNMHTTDAGEEDFWTLSLTLPGVPLRGRDGSVWVADVMQRDLLICHGARPGTLFQHAVKFSNLRRPGAEAPAALDPFEAALRLPDPDRAYLWPDSLPPLDSEAFLNIFDEVAEDFTGKARSSYRRDAAERTADVE